MFAQISSTLKELNEQWLKLSPGKRMGVFFVVVVLVACMIGLGTYVGEKSYAPLYTDLQPDASIGLVKVLQEENIPYLVSKEGTTVSIPPELIQPTLMKLAVRGSPGGHKPGLELFDKESFGTSSYVQRINYIRAIQGELIQTINTLKSVKKSNIHISLPPKSSFLEQSEDPKASVVIELYAGKILTKDEVRGVQNLVASSVEGLRPERVVIVDSSGVALSRQGDSVSALSQTMMERQKQVETEMERRIEDIVSRIMGQGNVVARVNAELDFDPLREQETLYDPEQSAVRSQNKSEDNAISSRPLPGGPAGAQAALPGPASVNPESKQNISKNTDKTNFEISSKTRSREKALGGIKRLSVAVLVNTTITQKVEAPADGKAPASVALPVLLEEKRLLIEKLVRNAVGAVADRDSVTIEGSPFATEDLEKADQMIVQQQKTQLIFSLLKYGTTGILLSFFFFMVVRPFIRWVTGLSSTKVETILPKTVEELEQMQDQSTNALPGLANLPMLEETVDLEKAEGELMREKIVNMVESAPHKAAQIITDWIAASDLALNKKGRR